jgi:glutamine amidotransferase
MCELFAMSSRFPATVRYSLEEFSRHGGLAGPHKDGWGIAYYDDGDVRLIKEAGPASDSACVRFVQDHPFSSPLVLSHIRRATQGGQASRNCQPFVRELGGAMHTFAHNGDLERRGLHTRLPLGAHRPVGETDSEYAFCALLERLRELWLAAEGVPPFADRLAIVSGFASAIRGLGPANFIYIDGDALFAHGHKRMHEGAGIRWPGLHVLSRRCARSDARLDTGGLSIVSGADDQQVVLLASVPLTSEPGWRALGEGELLAARGGAIVAQRPAVIAEPV